MWGTYILPLKAHFEMQISGLGSQRVDSVFVKPLSLNLFKAQTLFGDSVPKVLIGSYQFPNTNTKFCLATIANVLVSGLELD